MPKNAHFALNVETRDLDFLDARNEKRKIVEIPGNRDVETRRAATLLQYDGFFKRNETEKAFSA